MTMAPHSVEKRLIPVLISEGILEEKDVLKATSYARKKKVSLRDAILELNLASEEDFLYAFSTAFHVTCITLKGFLPESELKELVPKELAFRHQAVPVSRVGNTLTLAMANPLDVEAIDMLRQRTGLDVTPVIAAEKEIRETLEQFYGGKVAELVQRLGDTYGGREIQFTELEEDVNETSAPVVQAVNKAIEDAINAGASDVHIEPLEDKLRVRYRIDGVMREQMVLPKGSAPAIVSRVKIMATLDITEKRLPQDGRIYFGRYNRRYPTIDLRVSTVPTGYGEKVVMRIINRSDLTLGLDTLGFTRNNLEIYRNAIRAPYGMILHVGPTGSGKTTTLYAALSEINSPTVNIQTVEDPIEYQLKGISQTMVHPEIGLTFARALRSFLRQDPDILMVGEIRDKETAMIAVEAALTGHLLFSTLHTNDAVGTTTRLVEMGVEPFLVGSSLVVVCAQRLMRRLCERCIVQAAPDSVHKEAFALAGLDPIPETVPLQGAADCPQCEGSGYKGRVGVHELLYITAAVRKAINSGAREDEVLAAARTGGMTTLYQDAMVKVASGITSLEEALRVVRAEEQ
ncbi:MAG: Flp pilus assembly complex ATPase component TadA [Planctomycetes bacterium]|nr:Flp pilus assembly complex ATPase component TadA [Planctomycetota bacterium]